MMHVLGIDAGGTKTVCLLADDAGRVLAEARAVRGPITTRRPAWLLQLRAQVELYLDRAAASRL
jgi:N-acetylglucosamine kinase-like BadF-type ATPase